MEAAKTLLGTDKAKKAAEVQTHKLRASHGLTENLTAILTTLDQKGSSEYKGVNPNKDKWMSRLQVSQGSDNI